jgi:hypothetical protein
MENRVLASGRASDDKETFELTIEPSVSGGFALYIRYSGDCHQNATGAGVWQTVEKAKQVAQETVTRLLNGATISWQS